MHDELAAENLALEVHILGVNQAGAESGIGAMCNGRDLPLLQDTAEAGVWASWGVIYRDVVILDAENRVVAVYNLTRLDLSQQANYATLKAVCRKAAGGR